MRRHEESGRAAPRFFFSTFSPQGGSRHMPARGAQTRVPRQRSDGFAPSVALVLQSKWTRTATQRRRVTRRRRQRARGQRAQRARRRGCCLAPSRLTPPAAQPALAWHASTRRSADFRAASARAGTRHGSQGRRHKAQRAARRRLVLAAAAQGCSTWAAALPTAMCSGAGKAAACLRVSAAAQALGTRRLGARQLPTALRTR